MVLTLSMLTSYWGNRKILYCICALRAYVSNQIYTNTLVIFNTSFHGWLFAWHSRLLVFFLFVSYQCIFYNVNTEITLFFTAIGDFRREWCIVVYMRTIQIIFTAWIQNSWRNQDEYLSNQARGGLMLAGICLTVSLSLNLHIWLAFCQ